MCRTVLFLNLCDGRAYRLYHYSLFVYPFLFIRMHKIVRSMHRFVNRFFCTSLSMVYGVHRLQACFLLGCCPKPMWCLGMSRKPSSPLKVTIALLWTSLLRPALIDARAGRGDNC